MDYKPHNPVSQSLQPPTIGSIGSQGFGRNYSMQYWLTLPLPPQQGQPLGQPPMPQFSQLMQQRPGQPGQPVPSPVPPPTDQASSASQDASADWQEYTLTAGDGRRFYYNQRTKQSSWEKPLELMTPLERADASFVWKEFTTAQGKKYYYNKDTKQSEWTIPDELKLARELEASRSTQSALDQPSVPVTSANDVSSSPIPVTPVNPVANVAAESASIVPAAFTPLVSTNMHSSPMVKTENSSSHDQDENISESSESKLEHNKNPENEFYEVPEDVLVPRALRRAHKENNFYWDPQVETTFKAKYPVLSNIVKRHPLFYAIHARPNAPQVYVHQLWNSLTLNETVGPARFEGIINRTRITFTKSELGTILHLPTSSDPVVSQTVVIKKLVDLGFDGVTTRTTEITRTKLAKMWSSLFGIFNRCLTGKACGSDRAATSVIKAFHAFCYNRRYDYSSFIWGDLVTAWKLREKKNYLMYPRFLQIIIQHFLNLNPNIPKRLDSRLFCSPAMAYLRKDSGSSIAASPIPLELLNIADQSLPEVQAYRNQYYPHMVKPEPVGETITLGQSQSEGLVLGESSRLHESDSSDTETDTDEVFDDTPDTHDDFDPDTVILASPRATNLQKSRATTSTVTTHVMSSPPVYIGQMHTTTSHSVFSLQETVSLPQGELTHNISTIRAQTLTPSAVLCEPSGTPIVASFPDVSRGLSGNPARANITPILNVGHTVQPTIVQTMVDSTVVLTSEPGVTPNGSSQMVLIPQTQLDRILSRLQSLEQRMITSPQQHSKQWILDYAACLPVDDLVFVLQSRMSSIKQTCRKALTLKRQHQDPDPDDDDPHEGEKGKRRVYKDVGRVERIDSIDDMEKSNNGFL